MRIKRFLIVTSIAVAVGVGGAGAAAGTLYAGAKHDTVARSTFDQQLPIPPLAGSTVVKGTRVFTVDLKKGRADLGQGHSQLSFYGQDGTAGAAANAAQYLAPTLRAAPGERVRVDVTNDLGAATTVHWHGMHLPATMDGGPHQVIEPGTTWRPHWTIKQPPATLWYHPHLHGATADHVQNGLAGLFLLDDPSSPVSRALPHTYGVDDVPVMLQDKNFSSDGATDPSLPPGLITKTGYLGDTVLANGTAGAFFTATSDLVRLRLVNASLARIYDLAFTDGRQFSVIAGDGGLLEHPGVARHVTMVPGDRLEIVVRVKPGDRTVLRNNPVTLAGFPTQRLSGGDDTLDVLQLRGAKHLTHSAPLPDQLGAPSTIVASQVVRTRELDLEVPTINGKAFDMNRIDAVVTVDTTERWRVRNHDGMPHTFHIHDTQFQVESVNGARPPVELQGRQDNVLVGPGATVDLLVRFTDYPHPDTPYMFHCHMLWHEDQGMMGQFVVVGPGQAAGTSGT